MDCELATKVSRKNGRKSYLAIAWKCNPRVFLLSPDWAVLCNMIRQGEEVRVRKKCRSFM